MSYPPQGYSGTGEISAVMRLVDGQPPDLEIGEGSQLQYLVTGAMTSGELGLYHCKFLGPPSGADPHYHKTISEWFYIEAGTVQFYDGDRWVDRTQGGFLFLPRGGIHGFRNVSGEPASMLLGFVPGREDREEFFQGFADLAAGRWRPKSREEFDAFMREHDNFLVAA